MGKVKAVIGTLIGLPMCLAGGALAAVEAIIDADTGEIIAQAPETRIVGIGVLIIGVIIIFLGWRGK